MREHNLVVVVVVVVFVVAVTHLPRNKRLV